ncbi:MAG: hypothetical protein JHC33_03305 [Ignisphaera sp.]|nr:hypothetical protein [Ignisphaera sp.]
MGCGNNSFNYTDGNPGLLKDYNFFNRIDMDQFNLKGVAVQYFKISDIQPNYDSLYRDFVSDPIYDEPIQVRAILQIDENTTHGMEVSAGQVAERNGSVGFNIIQIETALGRPPILGDVIYMRQLNQRFQVFEISKDTYRLTMPLRYLCKVRLYQDTNSVGTPWSTSPTITEAPVIPTIPVYPSSTAPVTSVFGRVGNVVGVAGDYDATEITLLPVSGLAGDTNVQQAIEGLASSMPAISIMLGESLPAYTCYRIKNNKAYKVSSIDLDSPSVDGITIQTGVINTTVQVGNIQGSEYTSTTNYTNSKYLYLSQTGQLTTTIPSKIAGDIFALIVGRTIEGTNKFVLDPKLSIRLI